MAEGTRRGELLAGAAERGPLPLFAEWFEDARAAGTRLPDAMCLSTATPRGAPSSRMVLLKSFDERGFVFYTNFGSRKAREIEANPQAALLFHWTDLERQVRIEGAVTRVDEAEAATYFATRDHESRIGAWASRQSRELPGREILEERVREARERFADREVPLPPFWGGYRVGPVSVEFWEGRQGRLHDRLRFMRTREEDPWSHAYLYP